MLALDRLPKLPLRTLRLWLCDGQTRGMRQPRIRRMRRAYRPP